MPNRLRRKVKKSQRRILMSQRRNPRRTHIHIQLNSTTQLAQFHTQLLPQVVILMPVLHSINPKLKFAQISTKDVLSLMEEPTLSHTHKSAGTVTAPGLEQIGLLITILLDI